MATPTFDEITDLFNIKPKSIDSEDEEAYANLKSPDTFESDIVEVQDIVKEQNPVQDCEKSVDYLLGPSKKAESPKTWQSTVNEVPEVVKEPEPEPEPELDVPLSRSAVSPELKSEAEVDTLSIKNNIKLDDWNLESPSPKFDSFYSEKRNILQELMSFGGRRNFKRYIKELVAAKVEVSVSLYDCPAIHMKMQEVQAWRNRVKEIQMDCRYLKVEKAVELLVGLLARVEYIKPTQKQAGVVYEHLGDLELYCAELKDVYKSAEIIDKNLDSAYDCLSRQLTLAMPQKDRVVYESQQSPPPAVAANNIFGTVAESENLPEKPLVKLEEKEIPNELKGFDELLDVKEETEPAKVITKSVDLEDAAKKTNWDGLL